MKTLAFLTIVLMLFLITLTNCEKKDAFENSKLNAEVIGFVAEKCFCCWGWEIKVGDQIIKTDSLPDISAIGYTINAPIPVTIVTGKKKINCSNKPDYYEIKSLTIK
jgi:hypothetical protein